MPEHNKCILYIDDDEDDRDLLADALHLVDPGVTLKTAEDGLQGLKLLEKTKSTDLPCLIVLDLNMPFMDGRQTFEKLQNDEALHKIPVVIFSSSEKPEDKVTFNKEGVKFYTKPSHMSDLTQIASHMVDMCYKL